MADHNVDLEREARRAELQESVKNARKLLSAIKKNRPNDPRYKNMSAEAFIGLCVHNLQEQLTRVFPEYMK